MNAELVKKASEKITNPHVLVNIVSRRVRQLNAGGGGAANPLVANTTNMGFADIALREIIEEKIGFEMPEFVELTRQTSAGRNKPASWGKQPAPGRGHSKHSGKIHEATAVSNGHDN
jgi:DNA-directed RNA polymerase subunit omega